MRNTFVVSAAGEIFLLFYSPIMLENNNKQNKKKKNTDYTNYKIHYQCDDVYLKSNCVNWQVAL